MSEIPAVPEADKPFYLAIIGFIGLMTSIAMAFFGAYLYNQTMISIGQWGAGLLVGPTFMLWERYIVRKEMMTAALQNKSK